MNTDDCIKCGECTRVCDFLTKYDIDLKDLENDRRELTYNCLMCGECTQVCPKNIDGRKVALDIRQEEAAKGNFNKAPYKGVILEKKNYLFKNYSSSNKRSVLFPGCNFPSFFPETTKHLMKLLKEKADVGVAFDCCGKPIAELGMEKEEKKILDKINKNLSDNKVQELVTMCPNCYHYLKGKIDVEVIDIYKKLKDIGFEPQMEAKDYNFFLPCPDRYNRDILGSIKEIIHQDSIIKPLDDVQCCGLGGLAICTDREVSAGLVNKLKAKDFDEMHTYCATCYGNFMRNGVKNPVHILSEILNVKEEFPKGFGSVINRAKFGIGRS